MVLIKRYEVLRGGLPERFHILDSGRQSALDLLSLWSEREKQTGCTNVLISSVNLNRAEQRRLFLELVLAG